MLPLMLCAIADSADPETETPEDVVPHICEDENVVELCAKAMDAAPVTPQKTATGHKAIQSLLTVTGDIGQLSQKRNQAIKNTQNGKSLDADQSDPDNMVHFVY